MVNINLTMIINFMIIDFIKFIELVFLMNKLKKLINESFHLPLLINWTGGIIKEWNRNTRL